MQISQIATFQLGVNEFTWHGRHADRQKRESNLIQHSALLFAPWISFLINDFYSFQFHA